MFVPVSLFVSTVLYGFQAAVFYLMGESDILPVFLWHSLLGARGLDAGELVHQTQTELVFFY